MAGRKGRVDLREEEQELVLNEAWDLWLRGGQHSRDELWHEARSVLPKNRHGFSRQPPKWFFRRFTSWIFNKTGVRLNSEVRHFDLATVVELARRNAGNAQSLTFLRDLEQSDLPVPRTTEPQLVLTGPRPSAREAAPAEKPSSTSLDSFQTKELLTELLSRLIDGMKDTRQFEEINTRLLSVDTRLEKLEELLTRPPQPVKSTAPPTASTTPVARASIPEEYKQVDAPRPIKYKVLVIGALPAQMNSIQQQLPGVDFKFIESGKSGHLDLPKEYDLCVCMKFISHPRYHSAKALYKDKCIQLHGGVSEVVRIVKVHHEKDTK